MHVLRDPALSIGLVIIVGVVCGVLARLFRRRSRADDERARTPATLTPVLVGIAGAFLGFHFAMLSGLGTAQPIVPFLVTALVAGLTLLGWRAAHS